VRRTGVVLYALALISCLAALAGLVLGPDWIEQLTGAAPDNGDGSLELAWVIVPAAAALLLALAGYGLRRRSSIA
jgi:hypothetical protein